MLKAYRREYKYYLPTNLVDDFKKAISSRVTLDKYAEKSKEHFYTVRSIYYDTDDLKYYHEKVEGLCNRKKVRIRVYNNRHKNSYTFLEIKRKYENNQIKDRAKLLYSDLQNFLIERDIDKHVVDQFNSKESAERFLYLLGRYSLKPTSLVVYDREPYLSMFDSTTRITLDHNLRKADKPDLKDIFRDDILSHVIRDQVILEIKFYKGYSEWIQKIIEDFGLTRRAISKYTHAINGVDRRRINKARLRSFKNQITF